MERKAFTIVEFVVCLMIIVMVMGAAITVPFKMKKETKQSLNKKDGIEKCSCSDTPANNECIIEIQNDTGRYEFFTVQILGAGAAGSANKGGDAGEAKVLYYPMLTGKFLVKLGQGGIYGTNNINGGNTIIYKENDLGEYEIFEYALGGSGHNEDIVEDELYDESQKDSLKLGKAPAFGTGDITTSCGAGGDFGQNGKDGEVIIRW